MERQALVRIYYTIGLTFNEIAFVLAQKHRIIVSKRQLKRITASMGLYRRKRHSDLFGVASYISQELRQSGQLHGYRWMHAKCKEKGFVVDQETVRLFIKCADPEGVKCRTKQRLRRPEYSNKGPNYLWHMDGYDKLKQYGICIHGCVDGFSHNIMWMEAYSTNNDPRIIAGYFMDTVRRLHGCPRAVRADFGTENGIVRQIQIFLPDYDDNVTDAFLYGTSKCNQRIESWWGILRKQNVQFWMNVFERFKEDGHYCGDYLDQNLVRFCFLNLIQDELNTIVEMWNGHRIRTTKNQRTPSGRPVVLYNLPELCGADDYLHVVEEIRLDVCEEECIRKSEIPCDEDVFDLCHCEMEEHGWNNASNPEEAIELYIFCVQSYAIVCCN